MIFLLVSVFCIDNYPAAPMQHLFALAKHNTLSSMQDANDSFNTWFQHFHHRRPVSSLLWLSSSLKLFYHQLLTTHTSGRISGALVASFPGSLQCKSNHERIRNNSVCYIGNVTGGGNGDGEQHKDLRFSNFPTINAPLYKNSLYVTALHKNCSRVVNESQRVCHCLYKGTFAA